MVFAPASILVDVIRLAAVPATVHGRGWLVFLQLLGMAAKVRFKQVIPPGDLSAMSQLYKQAMPHALSLTNMVLATKLGYSTFHSARIYCCGRLGSDRQYLKTPFTLQELQPEAGDCIT